MSDELEFEYNESAIDWSEFEEGMYEGELKRIEVIETQYGKSLRWIFEVEMVEISGITSAKFSSRSKAFAWFSALGGEVRDGKVRLSDVIGKRAMVEVRKRKGRDGQTEFANIVDVKPLPKRGRKK